MSSKVLYRKYRPTKLKEVTGQEQVTTSLENALKTGKIGHAYLFIGPRGTGKTSVARIFAHEVNNFDYTVEDSYLDIIEIDAASNTGVDNIRELREKSIIAPTNGKYKVYIIDEVHMLTKSASNALLKTLEEPPEHVIFIMATTDAHKVPITISSRTQVFTFKLATPEIMLGHLQSIAKKEKINITDDALKLVVRRGGGSFRDSLSLLDQVTTLTDKKITAELLESALGLPQEQALHQLLDAYTSNPAQIQIILKDLLNTGLKPEIIASELINLIIDNPQPSWLSLLAKLPDVQPPFPEAKLLLAFLSNNSIQDTAFVKPAQHSAPIVSAKPAPTSVEIPAEKPILKPSTTIVEAAPAKETQVPVPSEPTPVEEPQIEPANSTPDEIANEITDTGEFDWGAYLDAIHADSDAVFLQLQKATHKFADNTLHIYPSNKFNQGVLKKPASSQILTKHLHGISLLIHEVGENHNTEDPTLSKISDIMGDVREVKGDMPF